jgi:Zn-dependent peptidase ImmA (M78 family)
MSNYSAAQIEQIAQETLRFAGAVSAPVDLARVVSAFNATLRYEDLEPEVSGALIARGHECHVIVNAGHHLNRQRFTIAHELGHLRLHHIRGVDRLFIDTEMRIYQRVGQASAAHYSAPGSTTSPREEREANRFAAALLMPAPLLEHAALQRNLLDELDIASMAKMFAVSEQAMSIRLLQLRVVESAIDDLFPEDGQPPEPLRNWSSESSYR